MKWVTSAILTTGASSMTCLGRVSDGLLSVLSVHPTVSVLLPEKLIRRSGVGVGVRCCVLCVVSSAVVTYRLYLIVVNLVGMALRLGRWMVIVVQFVLVQCWVTRCRSQGELARLRSSIIVLTGSFLGRRMHEWP